MQSRVGVTREHQEQHELHAKTGDVENERRIELRMRELGLWETKRHLEQLVAARLDANIDENDGLSRTLKRCRRRRAVLDAGESMMSPTEEIRNVIRTSVERDFEGRKKTYRVAVLMGSFTKDVTYGRADNVVTISGCTANGAHLSKLITLELPAAVDAESAVISYIAGVLKVLVPYCKNGSTVQGRAGFSGRSASTSSDSRCNGSTYNTSQRTSLSSISPIYSLHQRITAEPKTAPVQVDARLSCASPDVQGRVEGRGHGEGRLRRSRSALQLTNGSCSSTTDNSEDSPVDQCSSNEYNAFCTDDETF